MKLRKKAKDQPIPRLEAFRLSLLSPTAYPNRTLKPVKQKTATLKIQKAKKVKRTKIGIDEKLNGSMVVIEKIPMVQGNAGIKKSKSKIMKITKNRFNIFSRKKKEIKPAKVDAKAEFDKLFTKLNRKDEDEVKEKEKKKEKEQDKENEDEIIMVEHDEDDEVFESVEDGDELKKFQCHFDFEEYSKLQNSSRYVLLKAKDLLDPRAGYISLEEEMKRPEKKLEIYPGVEAISFDDGVCITGYMTIKPKTIKPYEQLTTKSVNFFVLEGEVVLKSTSAKTHPDLNVDILVGKKLKRNDCVVVRKNSAFLLENWTTEDAILGVSIF